ncbi:hypothetical protein AURDEDRAFT_116185 [Auricularia subglabra TFB-10046 SS5]|nr:hypothetical protein AURDEDRAFT_116185 [Auricularia subglabra TFB-10046 SS5]
MTLYQSFTRKKRRIELADSVLDSLAQSGVHAPPRPLAVEYDEELIREQLARNYAFLGDDGVDGVRKGRVAVIGCGGVGSWAAVMLCRSGVGSIRLVDFDYVTLSSLNRHATALLSDVGTPKVHCVARTLGQIAKWVHVDAHVALWRDDDEGLKLLDGVDWVVDAIDNIGTKVELLRVCHQRGIKVFASMGAGAKSDPTRIQIADISQTTYDPLARAVRQKLRYHKEHPVLSGIPVVYSTEVPSADLGLLPLAPEEHAKGQVNELAAFDDFRVRILPVLGPLPALFGLHIATFVVSDLARRPIANPLPVRHRRKLYEKCFKELVRVETRLAGATEGVRLPITEDDVGFVLDDLHRGRSVVAPHHAVPARPAVVRWDPRAPPGLRNAVLMEKDEAARHVREVLEDPALDVRERLVQVWGRETVALVERRWKEVDALFAWAL